MVIYEVNLNIDEKIYSEYLLWLEEHIKQMLQLPGFIQASLFKQEQEELSNQEKLTVQYQLESRADLQNYLTEHAPKMRTDGINHFKDKFSAQRRVFTVQDIILK